MFNIGEEIMYTKDGHNENSHIMAGTISDESIQYKLYLESGEWIVAHATHMACLDEPDTASISNEPKYSKEQIQYLYKEYYERLAWPIKLTSHQHKCITWHERYNPLYFK